MAAVAGLQQRHPPARRPVAGATLRRGRQSSGDRYLEAIMGMRMWLGSLAVVAGLSMPAVAWGQGKQDFTLIKKTGYALSESYVSPNDEEDWQEVVLWKAITDDAQSVDITFSCASKAMIRDMSGCHVHACPNPLW